MTFYKNDNYFPWKKFLGMNKCATEIICFNEVVKAISHRHKAHIKLRNKKSHTHTSD